MPVTKFVNDLTILFKKRLKKCFLSVKIHLYNYILGGREMSESNNYESQVPVYLFHQGNNARAYEYMGSHRVDENTVVFRVGAQCGCGCGLR